MTVQSESYYDAIQHLLPASTLVLTDVRCEEYEELIAAVGEAKGLRISYDSGRLQITTHSHQPTKVISF